MKKDMKKIEAMYREILVSAGFKGYNLESTLKYMLQLVEEAE